MLRTCRTSLTICNSAGQVIEGSALRDMAYASFKEHFSCQACSPEDIEEFLRGATLTINLEECDPLRFPKLKSVLPSTFCWKKKFCLSEAQNKDYQLVVSKFQNYFIGKRNIIYERAKFNRRSQGDSEPVEEFITSLYVLAENCNYGILKEEMIRDRLVVDMKNLQLLEKSQSSNIRNVANRKGGKFPYLIRV
ncbi:hypothetical protein LAZ67_23001543 [Cordylochernes scorpioides]|uniref:Uncharacterized protein n=1 Tax=Cordylochernes scorpioides TaxID=51811 RepID=A0ABY6LRV4_9ARAC|nr:hypothetical protein LAZ67_23001543 [Cordylochernes scorpioides]